MLFVHNIMFFICWDRSLCIYKLCIWTVCILHTAKTWVIWQSIQTAKERNCMCMCLHRVYVQEMHDVLLWGLIRLIYWHRASDVCGSIQQWLYSDAVKDWWPATPSHIITYLPIACKIINHLVCKWALQSMTFQKQECKCLVPNQSLCKLTKEQFGFVLPIKFSVSMLHRMKGQLLMTCYMGNLPIRFLKIISSHTAAVVGACQTNPFTVLQNTLLLWQKGTWNTHVYLLCWRFWFIVFIRPRFARSAALNGQ